MLADELCSLCEGRTKKTDYVDQFYGNPLLLCEKCGSLRVEKIPTCIELKNFYEQINSTERSNNYISDSYFKVMRSRAQAQFNLLNKYVQIDGAKILDYGCGYGLLLDLLKSSGAETYGFDYDPYCKVRLKEKGHSLVDEDIFHGSIKWDVVCLSHIIEHLPDPFLFLAGVKEHSRFIFIEVPNYEPCQREQFVNLEGHLWFFSENGLSALANKTGLFIKEIICCGPDIRVFWSNTLIFKMFRRVMRQITGDLFLNQYDNKGSRRIWLRLVASGKVK